jgi:hypothetical protein
LKDERQGRLFAPAHEMSGFMNRVVIILVAFVAVALGGGALVLGSLELPAPAGQTEKHIPDQRFPRQ